MSQQMLGLVLGTGSHFIEPGECVGAGEYVTRFHKWCRKMEAEHSRTIPQENIDGISRYVQMLGGCYPRAINSTTPLWASHSAEEYVKTHPNFPETIE